MTAADTAKAVRAALEPFVRPRDETAHIRRVLRAHLAAGLPGGDDDGLDGSLALVDLAATTAALPEARGLQRAYVEALRAHAEARRAFDERVAAASATAAPAPERDEDTGAAVEGVGLLQDHLAAVRLGRKRDRLQVVHRYLDALGERPVAVAAGEDYLHPAFIYGDATRALPSVPKAVMDGLAEEAAAAPQGGSHALPEAKTAAAAADLEGLVARLEKTALRAQLGLRQEEKRLAAAKERAARQGTAPPAAAAKLRALQVARDELIAWMETELGNAGSEEPRDDDADDEDDDEAAEASRQLRQSLLNGDDVVGGGGGSGGGNQKAAQLQEMLDGIHETYAEYVEARRTLVATVGTLTTGEAAEKAPQNPLFANRPQLPPHAGAARTAAAPATASPAAPAAPAASGTEKAVALGRLLLTPALERLLAVARDQRADLAHKAHYNGLLAKRRKDTCQMLDHLADESQLLPRYGASKRGDDPGGAGGGGGGGGAALFRKRGMLAPALEAGTPAAESVGQRVAAWTNAAESAKIATFEAVFEKVEGGQVALEQAAQWLDEAEQLLGQTPEAEDGPAGERPARKQKQKGDVWSVLDGELGLLKAEDRR